MACFKIMLTSSVGCLLKPPTTSVIPFPILLPQTEEEIVPIKFMIDRCIEGVFVTTNVHKELRNLLLVIMFKNC
jgi:hypothetical protein